MNQKIILKKTDFDAILVLNGEISHFEYIQENKGKIFAADGAANLLLNNNIIPDYIVGDLDSINKDEIKNDFNQIKIIEEIDQNYNDFEKTLKYINSLNKNNILIFGIQGGELEHTLNNWSVLKKYSRILNITIIHNNRYAIPISNSIELNLKENEIISIIPQPTCTITTSGLKWELNNEKLELGNREGARNIAIQKNIKINLIKGEYLLFIDSRY